MIGIRFADGLSAGGYEGVRLPEREARTSEGPSKAER